MKRIIKYAKKNKVGVKVIVSVLRSRGHSIDSRPTAKLTQPMLDDLSKIEDWDPLMELYSSKKKKKIHSKSDKKSSQKKTKNTRLDIQKVSKKKVYDSSTKVMGQFSISTIKFSDGSFSIQSAGNASNKVYIFEDDRIKEFFNEYRESFKAESPSTIKLLVERDQLKASVVHQKILAWFFKRWKTVRMASTQKFLKSNKKSDTRNIIKNRLLPREIIFDLRSLVFKKGFLEIKPLNKNKVFVFKDESIKSTFNEHIREYQEIINDSNIKLFVQNNKISPLDMSKVIKEFERLERTKDQKDARRMKRIYDRNLAKQKKEEEHKRRIKNAKEQLKKNRNIRGRFIKGWWEYKK